MAFQPNLYDTRQLLGVMQEIVPPSSYFLDLCFPTTVTFDTEYVDFEKLVSNRKLAPFVVPHAKGRPIYSEGSNVTRIKPAYIKPKDAVNPSRLLTRRPGQLLVPDQGSPAARYQALVADIVGDHRAAIERRWEWMAAQAILNGKVIISDEDSPERTVDFGRDNNNTVTLSGGAEWNNPASDPIADINEWRRQIKNQPFGGIVNRITLGADANQAFINHPRVREQLDTQVRGTNATLNTGVYEGHDAEYVGRIGTLEVWVYSGWYTAEDGTSVQYMDPKDIVLTGPAVQGVRAFGAILDENANFNALPIHSKMWQEQDPARTFVMSQSSPIMVPVNPNNTLRAKVLL